VIFLNKLIVGFYFPEYDFSFVENGYMSPGLLDVLPPGDNVKFCRNKQEFSEINDDDVLYYVVSVYSSGCNKFKEWAKNIDKNKIIVGGYHASLCPEDFIDYAFKIVTGPCDDLFLTISQDNQIVKGIVNHKYLPRYDLFKRFSNFIQNQEFKKTSVYTTMGCTHNCEFCCTPVLTGRKFICKPLDFLENELEYLKSLDGKADTCMIQDENLLKQKDWRSRLELINSAGIADSFHMFCSADILARGDIVKELKSYNISLVIIGIEDIDAKYAKNLNIKKAIENIQAAGIDSKCSFIINPFEMLDPNAERAKYDRMFEFLLFALPSNIHCNILTPYPRTQIYSKYKDLIDLKDYDNFNRAELFIKDNQVADRIWRNMHLFELRYFGLNLFKQKFSEAQQNYCFEQVIFERKLLNLFPYKLNL
jgi:radical SAM superfamily enzyme YgiQ (UPF0313 family)